MYSNEDKSKQLILVVDDQPNNLKVIASFLQESYALSFANNADRAMKTLERVIPDLIMLDIMMPDIDGYELCKMIKAIDRLKEVPIIFLSAKSDIEDVIKGFDYGAVDYITKPFNMKEVKTRIKTHIELSRAKRFIQKQNEELIQTNAEKDKFFSIISHDLRSPFSGFLGITQMMSEDFDSFSRDEMQSLATDMRKSANTLYNLLENLLEWSKVKRGIMSFNPQNLNLYELVDTAASSMKILATNKEIEILINIDKSIEVFCDYNMISTVFRNLISNAIKFSLRGGKVEVQSTHCDDEKYIKVMVKDYGIGMNENMIEKLFDIKYKTSRPGTENEASSGLGLILCKEFVVKNNGRIFVDSKENNGTSFVFTLQKSNV